MPNLSYQDRQALVEAALNQGRAEGDRFYIVDCYDDSCVLRDYRTRGTYQVPYSIDDKGKITLGKMSQVIARRVYDVVQMSAYELEPAEFAEDGDVVIRRGKVFEAGDYPDKQFSLTPEELKAAVAAFSPVEADVEHRTSPFDGQLGQLRKVELAQDGKTLLGEYAVPKWLHALFKDQPIKVSTTWDRRTKRIIGLAITKTPRVSDAAMMSAYEEFAGRRHSAADEADMQTIHDVSTRQGAVCKSPAKLHEEAKPMSFWQQFWSGLFGAAQHAEAPAAMSTQSATIAAEFAAAGVIPVEGGTRAQAETLQAAGADPRVEQLQREVAQLRAQRIQEEATHFADEEIRAGRAYPAERESIIATFTQAAVDDAAHGAVKFGEGETRSRVETLKATFAARPAHQLTREQVPTQATGQAALTNTTTTPDPAKVEMSAERQQELLKYTSLGQAALDYQKRQK